MSSPHAGCAGGMVRPRALHGVLAMALALVPAAAPAQPVDLDFVAALARQRAAKPYEPQSDRVPDWLMHLDYDRWREIRFRPAEALWAGTGLPFTAQFFHPGLFYDRTVTIHEVDAEGSHPIPFSPSLFDYGTTGIGSRVPQDLGFAGFRIHYPLKRPEYQDEVIVFLGASYFRAVGRNNVYGLSARGLAVDTALPSGEEFPWFREFWILRPAPGQKQIIVLALLDGPSVVGAYRFVVWPGVETLVDVEQRLFFRRPVKKLGIAPLTSMFLRGENTMGSPADYRPEVHDSDGLLVESSAGEWTWRPLEDRETLTISSFSMEDPRGFGLLQRDRSFDHYQDLEARPDLRPSAWVTPRGGWGRGHVELVEIPSDDDKNDNIVAYWVPRRPPRDGDELAYRLAWYGDDPRQTALARVVATRQDRRGDGACRFVVDFEGESLRRLPADATLGAVVTTGRGNGAATLVGQQVMRNPVTGGWRVVFRVQPRGDDPVELRASLQRGETVLSETWSYLLQP